VSHECRRSSRHWAAAAAAEELKLDSVHSLCDLKQLEYCNLHKTVLGEQGQAGHNCKVGNRTHIRTAEPFVLFC